MDGVGREQRQRLETIESELAEVWRRLDRLYTGRDYRHGDGRHPSAYQRAPGASGKAGDRRREGQGIALRAPGRAGQRGHHRRLRRGHERLPDDQRNHRIEGLHQVLRQGDQGQARKSNGLLHHPHAAGQPDRGRRRRRGGSPRPSSQFSTRWWTGLDEIKNRGRFRGHSIAGHGDGVRQ